MNVKMFVKIARGRMGSYDKLVYICNLHKARETLVDNIRSAIIVVSIKELRLAYPRFN